MNTRNDESPDRLLPGTGRASRGGRWGTLIQAGVIALALAGVGCAGFRGGELDEKRGWPPAPPQLPKKPSLSLSLVGKAEVNGSPATVPPAMAAQWSLWTKEVYASSGLFSELLPPGGPSDLRAEVEVTDKGSGSMVLAYICGLTLTIIPCRAKDEFTWKTTFKDGAGAVRGVIEKKESAIIWIQLVLIFVLPFSPPGSVTHEVMRDLNRSTILDAMERGYLKP